jgi:hypothetical protein
MDFGIFTMVANMGAGSSKALITQWCLFHTHASILGGWLYCSHTQMKGFYSNDIKEGRK